MTVYYSVYANKGINFDLLQMKWQFLLELCGVNRWRMKTMRSLKWLRPLLVVLFMSYYVGGTAFTHTHHFLNYSITHSHPYLPGADGLPHHEHSTVAFNTIEELTELCMELIPYLPLVMAWALLMVVLVFLKKEVVLRLVRRGESRAPPSFGIVI